MTEKWIGGKSLLTRYKPNEENEMDKMDSEILEDTYFKKMQIVYCRLADDKVPISDILDRMDKLNLKMARKNPSHLKRINKCATMFGNILKEAIRVVKTK